ncbi:MAG: cell filamentation protein Fic, partial [Bacteroidaceae bacterium]|nr:cell filamentation protein Fic [Bacteroidaceae bacterium]
MEYTSAAKMAEKWGLSERSVRNYCAQGGIADAKLIGKTWCIPKDAQKPERANKKNNACTLLQILREQKA